MDPRTHVTTRIDGQRDALIGLSHAIHADAEVAYEEIVSSSRVAQAAASAGFDVETGACGLDTAIVARSGSGPLHVGICAEYDALPGIGHACGHNIIAAAAVGAATALAEVADDIGITVHLLGTPAEEGGGGKIYMLERGGFDGLHAAMMMHPAPYEAPGMPCLAVRHLNVRYQGRSAHASAFPEAGINAADAITVAQVAVGLLRQHIGSDDRIHGIVTDGGDAPNIVPEHAAGSWYVRAATLAKLEALYPRVQRCFEAGALATGAQVTFDAPGPAYSEFLPDGELQDVYVGEATAIGRHFAEAGDDAPLSGSTDMANVSLVMPAIHPLMRIETDGAVNHQPGFTAAAVRPSADAAVRDGAVALARTVIATALNNDLRTRLESRVFSSH